MLATRRDLQLLAASALACATLLGCRAPAVATGVTTAPHGDRVYIFPGIGGGTATLNGPLRAFRDAGVTADLQVIEWPTPFFDALGHLQDYAANRTHAATVAAEIRDHRHQYPDATIDLVGYSGGGGVAILVVEALDPAVRPRNVVLVQAALSPDHDLTPTLRRLDGQLINLYCPSDWFMLGVGTRTFGTIDRVDTPSAGKDGFNLTTAVPDETLRAKVVQRPWQWSMIWTGHIGNHIGMLTPAWNQQYVAPWLLPPPPPSP